MAFASALSRQTWLVLLQVLALAAWCIGNLTSPSFVVSMSDLVAEIVIPAFLVILSVLGLAIFIKKRRVGLLLAISTVISGIVATLSILLTVLSVLAERALSDF